MLEVARAKVPESTFVLGDAADSPLPIYWGAEITDERFIAVSRR